jgi:hypothetical protein
MNELQCDDFMIPAFLLVLPPNKKDTNERAKSEEDFLENIKAWSECYPQDDWY